MYANSSCFLFKFCLNVAMLPKYITTSCPKTHTEWMVRSTAINCTDPNKYACLPNEHLTQLLEMCLKYQAIRIKKGKEKNRP